MAGNYNIPNLLAESFGLKVHKAYQPEIEKGEARDINYPDVQVIEDEKEALRQSSLGTPILFPIKLVSDAYRVFDKDGSIKLKTFDDFDLPISCVMNFYRPKVIKKTSIGAGGGTVKEVFGFDDYQINIRGVIFPDKNQAQGISDPYRQKVKLMQWNEIVQSVGVESQQLMEKGITKITIEDMRISNQQGRPDVMKLEMRCTSDFEINLGV